VATARVLSRSGRDLIAIALGYTILQRKLLKHSEVREAWAYLRDYAGHSVIWWRVSTPVFLQWLVIPIVAYFFGALRQDTAARSSSLDKDPTA